MKLHKYLLLLCLAFVNMVSFAQVAKNGPIVSSSFKVFGACEQCKARIESAVKLKGVNVGVWDVDTKMLTLEYDTSQISIDKIQNKILSVGHDLVGKKAKDNIYKQLPECCHYREMELEENVKVDTIVTIKGVVLQENAKGKFEPLSNVGKNKLLLIGITPNIFSFNIEPLPTPYVFVNG